LIFFVTFFLFISFLEQTGVSELAKHIKELFSSVTDEPFEEQLNKKVDYLLGLDVDALEKSLKGETNE
jgi:hypothetical protein